MKKALFHIWLAIEWAVFIAVWAAFPILAIVLALQLIDLCIQAL